MELVEESWFSMFLILQRMDIKFSSIKQIQVYFYLQKNHCNLITDSSINSKTEDEIDSNQDNNKKKMSKEIITVIVIVVLVLIVAVVIGVVFYINKHKKEESSAVEL